MEAQSTVLIPRVAIKFCTQCKWNLRAAYYAQELLQTFSTTLGEVSLLPSTNGIFTITLYHQSAPSSSSDIPTEPTDYEAQGQPSEYSIDSDTPPTSTSNSNASPQPKIQEALIWDRKRDLGFPETKELKNRIRNIIDPARDMGHIDRSLKKGQTSSSQLQLPPSSTLTSTSTSTPQQTEPEPEATGSENLTSGENFPVKPQFSASGGEDLDLRDEPEEQQGGVSIGAIDPNTGKPRVECEDCT